MKSILYTIIPIYLYTFAFTQQPGYWFEGEKHLTNIRMLTNGGENAEAYLSFDENNNGTIELGKRADFTIMGDDPRLVSPQDIPHIPFTMTVVGGEIVWSE